MAEENEFEKMAEIVMQNMIAVPKYTNGKDDCRYSKQSKIIARAMREVHDRAVESCAKIIANKTSWNAYTFTETADELRRLKKSNS